MKKKIKILLIIILIGLIGVSSFFLYKKLTYVELTSPYYLCSDEYTVKVLDSNNNEYEFVRGMLVDIKENKRKLNDKEYDVFEIDDVIYYVNEENLCLELKDVVKEDKLYSLRSTVTLESYDSYLIKGFISKNEEVKVSGYYGLNEDGSVSYYYLDDLGYVSSKYLAKEYYETAYDASIYEDVDSYADDPTLIEYYPKEELNFENNKMPEIVKALYINAESIVDLDEYLSIAKDCKINSFVLDIKDCYLDTQLAYESEINKQYAPSTSNVVNSFDVYKKACRRIKEEGYYLIGRITAFKDDSFALDNKQEALLYKDNLYRYGGVYWPSIYSRKMWEYNVGLALEAVEYMGFDEINFDYVRLPEDTVDVDLRNEYDEGRLEALIYFLRYASDILHEKEVYVSADVFGEISGYLTSEFTAFVSGYGQFWCAISNATDVICSMPYPDHFSNYAYGIEEPWLHPYELMYGWGRASKIAQDNTYDKAKCRTWILAQDSESYGVIYDVNFIADQINGLKDAGIYDGFLTWNAASSYYKYNKYKDAFN